MRTLRHMLLALTAAILLATPLAASAQEASPGTGVAGLPLRMLLDLARVAAIEPASAETRSRATLPSTPLRQDAHAARPPAAGSAGSSTGSPATAATGTPAAGCARTGGTSPRYAA